MNQDPRQVLLIDAASGTVAMIRRPSTNPLLAPAHLPLMELDDPRPEAPCPHHCPAAGGTGFRLSLMDLPTQPWRGAFDRRIPEGGSLGWLSEANVCFWL